MYTQWIASVHESPLLGKYDVPVSLRLAYRYKLWRYNRSSHLPDWGNFTYWVSVPRKLNWHNCFSVWFKIPICSQHGLKPGLKPVKTRPQRLVQYVHACDQFCPKFFLSGYKNSTALLCLKTIAAREERPAGTAQGSNTIEKANMIVLIIAKIQQ